MLKKISALVAGVAIVFATVISCGDTYINHDNDPDVEVDYVYIDHGVTKTVKPHAPGWKPTYKGKPPNYTPPPRTAPKAPAGQPGGNAPPRVNAPAPRPAPAPAPRPAPRSK